MTVAGFEASRRDASWDATTVAARLFFMWRCALLLPLSNCGQPNIPPAGAACGCGVSFCGIVVFSTPDAAASLDASPCAELGGGPGVAVVSGPDGGYIACCPGQEP
jgi:hypothetical protein